MNDVERVLRDALRSEVPDRLDCAVEAMIRGSEVCSVRPARARRLAVALSVAAVVVAAVGAMVWVLRPEMTHRTVVAVEPGPVLRSALVPDSPGTMGPPLGRGWRGVETVFLAGGSRKSAGRREGS